MQKLKLNLQQLNNVEVLTRSQLKNVLGGSAMGVTGNCCAHTKNADGSWGEYQCGYSSESEAQAAADDYASSNHVHAYYCCNCSPVAV